MCVLEAFEDRIPFAFESLRRLLMKVFDRFGAVRVVALDFGAELGGELQPALLLGFVQ